MRRINAGAMLCHLASLWLMATDVAQAQCPMCRTGLTHSPEGQQMATGFNNGILFLLTIPFLIVGGFALVIVNARRRSRSVDT